MQGIDDGRNNVFSIMHKQFGKCVLKFLTADRNVTRYLSKVHPAIKDLYKRTPEHPHIATIEEPKQYAQNRYFVVIREYGECFQKFIRSREEPFSADKLLDYAFQISHGLAQLQWAGINHRDVKPSNIIRMQVDDVLKIIDFDISKTLRSDFSISTKTENQMTIKYASPNRIIMSEQINIEMGDYPSFKEDAFSLGLVFLEMLLTGRPDEIQEFNKSIFMTTPKMRTKKKDFEKALRQFLQPVQQKIIAGAKFEIYFKLIVNLLSWNAEDRIDLMATCKYLRMALKGQFTSLDDFNKFIEKESTLSQERHTGEVCSVHQEKWHYVFEHAEREEVKEVEYGAISQDTRHLIIFHSSDNSFTSHKIPNQAPGTAVLTTQKYVFLFGGEDPDTGNTLSICERFTLSTRKWDLCHDIPDHGRNACTPASYGNLIALVGGYRVNCQMASRILCFNLSTSKWDGDNIELTVKRLNPAVCFTQQFLYIFGGLTSSGDQAITYSGEIERAFLSDLQSAHMLKKTDIVQLRENEAQHSSYLKFMSGMAVLINPEQIMIFGGLRDPGYDEEIDGLLYNWKNNTFLEFKQHWGITRTCFPQQGLVSGNALFLSQQMFKEGPLFLKGQFKDNILHFSEHPSP